MRPSLITVTVLLALTALAGCRTDSPHDEALPVATPTAEGPTEPASGGDIDPRLEVLVGTWEADPDEVGPHGSTLEIREDGTASLSSFVNQHGSYEGTITLGTADPHVFEGTEPETGGDLALEFEFDADADTLTLEYEEGPVVHTRA